MKKQIYNISIKKDDKTSVLKVEGYVIERNGCIFGVDHRWKNGWVITELRTGRQVFYTIPRLRDFWTYITDEKCEQIKRILEKSEIEYVNDIDRF